MRFSAQVVNPLVDESAAIGARSDSSEGVRVTTLRVVPEGLAATSVAVEARDAAAASSYLVAGG